MSVKEKLLAGDSSLTGLNGAVPEVADQQLSTLHIFTQIVDIISI